MLPPGGDSMPPLCVGNIEDINSVAFNPDGTILAAARGDNSDPAVGSGHGGTQSHPHGVPRPFVRDIVFSPDGRTLIAGGQDLATTSRDKTVRLWNVPTGQLQSDSCTDKYIECHQYQRSVRMVEPSQVGVQG